MNTAFGQKKFKPYTILVSLFLLTGSFLSIISYVERKPGFCGTCHTKSGHFKLWKASTHGSFKNDYFGRVVCADCHIDPGIRGFFKAKFDGIRHLGVSLFSFPEEYRVKRKTSVTLRSEPCLKCHRGIKNMNYLGEKDLPDLLRNLGLKMAHQVHIEKANSCKKCHTDSASRELLTKTTKEDIKSLFNEDKHFYLHSSDIMSCTSCHEDLVHNTPKKYKKNIPMEVICEECHRENPKCKREGPIFSVSDEKKCTRCHPNQF